ncbi:type I restriction enzyme, S subunit [Janthinobacterium sp. TND4EL3]|uniref:restriction endonuclease subunit S n=1 Tax=Janthinobacterium sp. TND4EL3 TaxID=1907311 RepID=UPI000953E7DF|nr:restriction endonuclease subunit S [Janthinobacterium sp. TND4EL3]SIR28660.1 type I restriction enzyme, S subunit [Janthinobacterium sp. TND4EL3]
MSNVNFFERLLDGVTVEWKTLGDVTQPTTNIKWREANRSYQYIDLTSVSIEAKAIIETSEITSSNAPSRAQKLVKNGDVIFATTRPAQQRYCLIDDAYDSEVASTGYCILRANRAEVLPKWILYWIASADFKEYVEKNQSGSAYPAISDAKVKDFKIPVPCPENSKKSLEIQAEIVRILDAFTELTSELTTELSVRKKQYNYYRDQLLSFEKGKVEWKPLGEVCRLINGRAYKQPELLENGKYPVLRVGNFFTNGNWYYSDLELDENKYCDNGDLLYAWSASFGPKIWDGKKVIYHYHIWKVIPDVSLVLKNYLFHVLAWDMDSVKSEHGTGSTMMHIGKGSIEKRLVPVPSINEQARIVEILDNFEALTNSNTEGLPREIELRQKQYAYYRDLLFSFPKPEEVEA